MKNTYLLPLLALLVGSCAGRSAPEPPGLEPGTERAAAREETPAPETLMTDPALETTAPSTEIATFGAGCFWCVEAVLEQIEGVLDVDSGYMGGDVANPSYKEVCTGRTGHAEVVQVTFDPKVLSYAELLSWFWRLHDPTTLDRQGNDVGTQYRSAIFYHSEAQREAAEKSRAQVAESGAFLAPIVTEIEAASAYYPAEDYHQDYYRGNKEQGYCRIVIAPKLDKLGLEK